jgi:hypothetical protein
MKPDHVKITGISMSPANVIYGLGDDSKVYVWNKIDGYWTLHVEDSDKPDLV